MSLTPFSYYSYFQYKLSGNNAYSITDKLARGVYAMSVSGELPPQVVRELVSRGIVYKSRDTSVTSA